MGDTVSRRTVEVRKYVLPKFKVQVAFEKPFYAPGAQVRGSVQADYFFGKPVVSGKVTLDVRSIDIGSQPLTVLNVQTDDSGRAEFEFSLPSTLVGREQDGGAARIAVAATVEDTAGQTFTTLAGRLVTDQPITLEVIPESGTLVKGLANKVYLFARYADGRPAPARIVVHGEDKELKTNELGMAVLEIRPDGPAARGAFLRAG